MNAQSSLDRAVVWRFETPPRPELESFARRLAADLTSLRTPAPARPFLAVTPAGARFSDELFRALAIRGVAITERRSVTDWPRIASALHARSLDHEALLRAFAHEELWRGLFPREDAEVWILDGDRAFERARAWKAQLRERLRGVQVTVQSLYDSFEAGLHAFHVPEPTELEREWRALTALRAV
ncbi:MAG: hypothetical protein HZA53_06805 [Planctomycetes bacterium]|nr:hypothetical protein [Planctomycetota bacterium]